MLIKMSKFVVVVVGPYEPGLPSGGDVWVLVIKNSKPSDSGIYVCEVNSNPIVRSFHKLSGKYLPCITVYNLFCLLLLFFFNLLSLFFVYYIKSHSTHTDNIVHFRLFMILSCYDFKCRTCSF